MIHDELSVYGSGCIARGCRALILDVLRTKVLPLAHDGHSGIVKMKSRCKSCVWWLGLDSDLEHYMSNFSACVLSG